MCEINFLCAHKKLRSKRLAPVLIKEITRRVNLRGVFQACYTAGAALPTPVATCKYFHRSLNLRKLVDIKFMVLGHTMTISRAERLYRVPPVCARPCVCLCLFVLQLTVPWRFACAPGGYTLGGIEGDDACRRPTGP